MSLCCSPQSQNPALSHQSSAPAEEQCSVQGPICSPEGHSQLTSSAWAFQPHQDFSALSNDEFLENAPLPRVAGSSHHHILTHFFPQHPQQEGKIPHSLWSSHPTTAGQHQLWRFPDLLSALNISWGSGDGLGLGCCVLLDLIPRDWGWTGEAAQDAWDGFKLVPSLKSP